MILKFITIKNFRGVNKLEKFELSNLNTFVGKNDTGKSAILMALNCFFDEKKFDIKDVFKGKPENETIIIELSFLTSVEIDDLALDENRLLTIKKEFFLVNGKLKLQVFYLSNDFNDSKFHDLWNKKEPELNNLILELGQKPEKLGRGKKKVLRIEQIKDILKNYKRQNKYHELGDFLINIEKTYGIKLPEYSLFGAEQSLDIQATNFQSQFKSIITNFFDSTSENTDEIEKGLKERLYTEFNEIRKFMNKNVPGLKELNPTTEFDWSKSLKKFDLNLKFEGESFDIPISHKGTGFKRLLMVAYFEYLASKKEVYNHIFAIEEPETYLHPSAQEDLLNSIIKISESSQFFLTTHSPVFAGATDGLNSILVTKDAYGVSLYSRGGNSIIEQIINELGIKADYNLLKNTKYILFVEGPDDVSFLKIAAKKLLDKDLQKDRIACVIGGGSSLSNYAELDLLKEIPNKCDKYAVFIDGDNGDESKQKEKERIRAKCEKDKALFCQISKREIENYCCPDKIKYCYIDAIKQKEGIGSQNPRIKEIEALEIKISDDTDVEKYLRELGLEGFKSNLNIKVFESMTKEEWQASDSGLEVKHFIENIYTKI
ncbi:MAG TPA: AAA family ATPase [Candidatus Paceibacterota bacterium]|nr:AAA family ATPase [Candidatus Paceibacterota bacterium]